MPAEGRQANVRRRLQSTLLRSIKVLGGCPLTPARLDVHNPGVPVSSCGQPAPKAEGRHRFLFGGRWVMLSLTGVVLATSIVLGQADQTGNLLDEYGRLTVGRWIGDVTLVADWPGYGKKGEKLVGHLTFRRIADGKGLEDEGYCGNGTGRTIYFWDPVSKKIKCAGMDSGGTIFEGEISKEGDQWVCQFHGALADGTKMEGKNALIVKDGGNTIIFEGEGTIGTEPMLPLHDVYRRVGSVSSAGDVAGQEPVATAEDYIAMQQNHFAGEWTTKVLEGEGAGSTGTYACRLDPSGKSFDETATSDGKVFFHAIGGYDPVHQALKEVVYYADGSTATLIYRHPQKLIQGSLVGKTLKGTMEYVSSDGQKKALEVLVNTVEQNKTLLTIHKQGDPKAVFARVIFERKIK
jgi:hypothetical protein